MTDYSMPDIPEEVRRLLSNGRRHHYIPQFLQRRFGINPEDKTTHIHTLDVRSGKTGKAPIKDVAVVSHHNTLYEAPNTHPGFVEALLSYIEGRAAPLIQRLVQGDALKSEEYLDLTVFIHAQQQRTPRGRESIHFILEKAGTAWLLKRMYEGREISRGALTEELGRAPTEDEIDTYIKEIAQPFEDGSYQAMPPHDMEIAAMFMSAEKAHEIIYEMHWILIDAPAGESFILSDEPLARLDPQNPGGPTGWRASPTLEVTLPLDPKLCLMLTRFPERTTDRITATPSQVLDINLRTYASAREHIYGPTQQLLQSVRAAAKKAPGRVADYRPSMTKFHVIERVEGMTGPPKVTTAAAPTKVTIRRGRKPTKTDSPDAQTQDAVSQPTRHG